MGIILDSSIVISAERRGSTVVQLLRDIATLTGDQEVGLSAVGLTELVHGIYRANTPERRKTRELFINELISFVGISPFTREAALIAGKIDGEQQAKELSFHLPTCSSEQLLSHWDILSSQPIYAISAGFQACL